MATYKSEVFIVGDRSGPKKYKTIHDEIELEDGELYTIKCINNTNSRMVCETHIGENIAGRYVVYPHRHITIDRPTDVNNKFKCVRRSSLSRNQQAFISNTKFDEIKIIVTYEDKRPRQYAAGFRSVFNGYYTGHDTVWAQDSVDETGCFGGAAQHGLKVETDSGRSSSVGGTVLAAELSNVNYTNVDGFPVLDDSDTFIYKLMCKGDVKVSPLNLMFEA